MTIEVKAFLIFAGICFFVYHYLERGSPKETRNATRRSDSDGGVFIDSDTGGDCGGGD